MLCRHQAWDLSPGRVDACKNYLSDHKHVKILERGDSTK